MNLREQLIRHEGFVSHAYQDHLGFWTIGIGRLIDKRKGGGITREEAEYLLDNDIEEKTGELEKALPWVTELDDERRSCLVAMSFQMGVPGLLKFKATLAAVERRDFRAAALAMLNSEWAKQTPERAKELAEQMRTGEFQ